MTDFNYTHDHSVYNSSLVSAIMFDRNTNHLVVNLETPDSDNYYRYSNVPFEVFEAFTKAESAGNFYNTRIKNVYGPSELLGSYQEVAEHFVNFVPTSNAPVVNAIDYTQVEDRTQEFSLGGVLPEKVVDDTDEYSLAEIKPAVETQDLTTTAVIHYRLNGKKSKFTAINGGTDVQDVLDEFGDIVSRLGLTNQEVVPTKVVFKFA